MKLIKTLFLIFFLSITNLYADNKSQFNEWKNNFKELALKNDISEKTFDRVMLNVKFLPNVIKKIKKGSNFYKENINLINQVEKRFDIEKELLLSLMGIETNFGTYVGKMDILSSLATLSYDKRRSEFFTNELLILLKLIDNEQINYKTLYGSWAGAFGFFQFMPSTIKNHAIDYDNDNYIDLKSPNDAYASAGNYLSNMGWDKDSHCFYKVDLDENISKKYLNVSAKKLKNKKKLKYFKKYINNYGELDFVDKNLEVAIIIPDAETLTPAYIVFKNYEIILKWNRSLRFALAVCTLKDKIKDEL